MCAKLPDYANIKLAINLAESFKKSIIYLRSQATLYEKLIGIDSRNTPYGIGKLSWEKYLTEKAKKSVNVLKNKFIYGGYYLGTIEDKPSFKEVFSKPRYSNIHLFNELAELNNYHQFFNDLINPEIALGPWKVNDKDGFLKLVDFNKYSEGNQKFIFKIE